jgi:hypothetical protein
MTRLSIPSESAKDSHRAASTVSVGLERIFKLVGFIAIFGSALSGYSALGPWAIVLSAIALASISRAQFEALYRRAEELGLERLNVSTTLRSFGNALVASGAAYFSGVLFRLF